MKKTPEPEALNPNSPSLAAFLPLAHMQMEAYIMEAANSNSQEESNPTSSSMPKKYKLQLNIALAQMCSKESYIAGPNTRSLNP